VEHIAHVEASADNSRRIFEEMANLLDLASLGGFGRLSGLGAGKLQSSSLTLNRSLSKESM